MKAYKDKKAYVVCAKPRAVFFGYASDDEINMTHPVLHRPRMCIYWSVETRGVVGLSSHGPQNGSRISPAGVKLKIKEEIEAIFECSNEAIDQWEKGLWD